MVRCRFIFAMVLGGLVLGGTPALYADEPTSRPAAREQRMRPRDVGDGPRDARDSRDNGRGDKARDARDNGRPMRFVPPSEEEWKLVEAFAAQYSPNRLVLLNKMRDAHEPGYRMAQGFLVSRYRAIASMKENDPDLYAARVEGLKLEDSVFGAVEAGDGAADAPANKKDALRENVAKLVASNLAERERRINRMKEILAEQDKQLEADKTRQDQLVDEKMKDIERDGVKSLMPGNGFQKRKNPRDHDPHDDAQQPSDAPAPDHNPPPPPPAAPPER